MGFLSFDAFSVMFTLAFLLIFGMFVVTAIRGISQWNKNNHSPKLTVPVSVVTKRTNVSRHSSGNGTSHTSTSYYVTFQVESGDRIELCLSGQEYGMMAEGDRGNLTFQGTRFLNFDRT